MKKKELPRLTLNRETLLKLDASILNEAAGAGDLPPSSQICCPNPH
jgi:hypothetical protein